MQYTTNPITKRDLLKKLNANYGEGDWQTMLNHCSYSLVADTANFKDYPQYYDFENLEDNHYVVEVRHNEIVNIYRIDEIDDYEYSCQEIFWATANQWTDNPQHAAETLFALG